MQRQRVRLRSDRNDFYTKVTRRLQEKATTIFNLYQDNFTQGSYIIEKPGLYKLEEDINFGPSPKPGPEYAKYKAFHLGYFAAIIVGCNEVIIDLNGHELKGLDDFFLHQPYFSCIETNPAPFIPKEGPGDFGPLRAKPKYIWIRNGTLGRSSHHGIHGNYNKYVIVENVTIKDFDFVGCALNAESYIYYKDCQIEVNNHQMVLNAKWSAAIFLKLWTERFLKEYPQLLPYYNNLNDLINEVIRVRRSGRSLEDKQLRKLFSNKSLLPDGNCYGIVSRPPGMAVHDFADFPDEDCCHDFYILNCQIKHIKAKVDEVIGVATADGQGTQIDPAGAVFRVDEFSNINGVYQGNPLSDLQLQLAKLPQPVSKISISPEVIQWSETPKGRFKEIVLPKQQYLCGQDTMAHLNKGVIGVRIEATNHVLIEGLQILNIVNQGHLGSEQHCGHYQYGCQPQQKPGYRGADAFGCHFSSCKDVAVFKGQINGVRSYNGIAAGMCFINHCHDTSIDEVEMNNISAGYKYQYGKWTGVNYQGEEVAYDCSLPNKCPAAVGIIIKDPDCKITIGSVDFGDNFSGPIVSEIMHNKQ